MANPRWPVEFEWGNSGCALTVPEARELVLRIQMAIDKAARLSSAGPSAICDHIITVHPPDGHTEPPTTHRCVKPRGHTGKHATAHGGFLVEVPDAR